MDARDYFPEWDAWKNGDPYIKEIVTADDIICDHRYNASWLGLDEPAGAAIADSVERQQLSYELEVLYRWWALESPQ